MYQTTRQIKFDLGKEKTDNDPVDMQVLRRYESENSSLRRQIGTLKSQLAISQKLNERLDEELHLCKKQAIQLDVDKQLEYRRHEKALIELRNERDESLRDRDEMQKCINSQIAESERLLTSSEVSSRATIEELEGTIHVESSKLQSSNASIEELRSEIVFLNRELQTVNQRMQEKETSQEVEEVTQRITTQLIPQQQPECHKCDVLQNEVDALRRKLKFAENALLKQVDLNDVSQQELLMQEERTEQLKTKLQQSTSECAVARQSLADAQLRMRVEKDVQLQLSSVQVTAKPPSDEGSAQEVLLDSNIQQRKIELLEQRVQQQDELINELRVKCAGAPVEQPVEQIRSPPSQLQGKILSAQALEAKCLHTMQETQTVDDQQVVLLSTRNAELECRVFEQQKRIAGLEAEHLAAVEALRQKIAHYEQLISDFEQQIERERAQIGGSEQGKAGVLAKSESRGSPTALSFPPAPKSQIESLLDKTANLSADDAALIQFVKDNCNARMASEISTESRNEGEIERLRLENKELRHQTDGQRRAPEVIDASGTIDTKALYSEYIRISEQQVEYINNIHFLQLKVEQLEDQSIELNRANKNLISRSKSGLGDADLRAELERERQQRRGAEEKLGAAKKELGSAHGLIEAQRRQIQAGEAPRTQPVEFQTVRLQSRVRQLEDELGQVRQLKGSQAVLQQQNAELLHSLSQCERAYNELVAQNSTVSSQHENELDQLREHNQRLERQIGELSRYQPAVSIPLNAVAKTPVPREQESGRIQLGDLMTISPGEMVRQAAPQRKKLRPDQVDDGFAQ